MKIKKRITALALSLMTVLLLLPVQVLAAGSIDTGRDVRLTISYRNGNTALSGAAFDIFRVASVNTNGELTPVAPFDQFNVDIRGKNDAAWKALASTLEGFVLRDNIAPADSGKTDKQGLLIFPNQSKHLEQGLYLVLGHRHTQGGRIYDAAPFMVLLPAQDKEANDWLYDVTVNPKHDFHPEPDEPDEGTITRKVLKVWADEGHEEERPQEVIVQLLRDGKVYDTVTLNAANNWRYTWNDLDDRYTWTIVEKELEDYTVTVTLEGVTFVVTNTLTPPPPPPPDEPDNPPDEPDNPDIPDHPDEPDEPDTPDNPDEPDEPDIPQTGQLWWPVPLLACGGMGLFLVGWLKRRNSDCGETDE